MNEDLNEFVDMLDELDPALYVIGVYWNTTSRCWRVQMDSEDFLREFDFWDENKYPGNRYPYELVVDRGNVEVFCLVKEVPE